MTQATNNYFWKRRISNLKWNYTNTITVLDIGPIPAGKWLIHYDVNIRLRASYTVIALSTIEGDTTRAVPGSVITLRFLDANPSSGLHDNVSASNTTLIEIPSNSNGVIYYLVAKPIKIEGSEGYDDVLTLSAITMNIDDDTPTPNMSSSITAIQVGLVDNYI